MTADPALHQALTPQDPHFERRWLILAVVAIAQLMVVLDTTVVNIALPSAQHALGFSTGDRQWVVTAYALAFGSLLLLGGRLADLVGRKRMFLIGLVGFAGASAVAGAATGFDTLVAARAVQGAFGAMLAPAALSLMATTFTIPAERARAFAIYSAIAGGGAAIGLLLGGVLTEYLSWRWCMFINLFFAAAAFAGGSLLLRNSRAASRPKLDIPSVVTASVGLFGLVYGFSHAETGGWASPVTIGFLAGGLALLTVFVVLQSRVAHPLLPLRIVLDRNRGGAYLAIFAVGTGVFGVFLFVTYYLQQTLGFSAVQSGLAFLPMTGALVITAQLSARVLSGRIGPRFTIAPGLAIAAIGTLLLTRIGIESSYVGGVLPATLVFGAGIGLTISSSISRATIGVTPADSGVASAMVNTGQQVGGSLGTSLLNTIAATAATTYLHSHASQPALIAQAAIHGYTTAFTWSTVILAVGAATCALILRPRP